MYNHLTILRNIVQHMLANDPIKSIIGKILHQPQFVVCRGNRVKNISGENMILKRNLIMTRRVVWYTTRLMHFKMFRGQILEKLG